MPRAPSRAWRGLARGLDGLATLVVLLPLALYVPLLRPEWRLLGLVLVAGPGAYWLRTPGGWLPRGPGFLLLSLLVLGWLVAGAVPAACSAPTSRSATWRS